MDDVRIQTEEKKGEVDVERNPDRGRDGNKNDKNNKRNKKRNSKNVVTSLGGGGGVTRVTSRVLEK